MQTRSLVLVALGSVFIIGATAPAFADWDGWHDHEWRDRQEWREHHGHRGWGPGYNPPVYYAPPPPAYYAPPPVVSQFEI